jgi:NADH:ubiquinone oxidoreductase subunit E
MIKMQKMRYSNDCAIAAVAMALRVPYSRVFAASRFQEQFKPNGRLGCYPGQLIIDCGFECEYIMRRAKMRATNYPVVVSVKSVNNRVGRHAVVVCQGRVYDPSNKRQVTIQHVRRTGHIVYKPVRP